MKEILFKNATEDIKYLVDKIKETIKGTHFENHVYLCGGVIRDLLLKLPIKDIDIVVDIKNGGELFANYMAAKNKCYVIEKNPVIFQPYGTAKFQLFNDEMCKDICIECSETKRTKTDFGTIQEDAKRRDLTINSFYYNISDEKIYDYNETSLYDLTNQILKAPSDSVFQEDPIKILRVIRFSCTLGWDIEKNTWLGMIKNAHLISTVPQEKITNEIVKILVTNKPSVGIRKMLFCGVLHKVMPDIYDTIEGFESRNPLVSTFDHSLDVLDDVQPFIESRLAALFHDVAKIITDSVHGKGICRLSNPDEFSAEVAESDLKRMRFSNQIIDSVKCAILHHRAFNMCTDGVIPSDKKIRKFVNDCGDNIGTTLDLMQSNNIHRTYGKKTRQVLSVINRIEELEKIESSKNIKLPINGKMIMQEFNLKSTPTIGILIDAVKDAYFENPNITKEECFKVVENKLKEIY